MHLDREYVGELTPQICRNGPIKNHSCTDFHCCVIYLILLAAVLFFTLLSVGGIKMTAVEIKEKVDQTKFGDPFYSIIQAWIPVTVSLAFIMAICFIFVVTSLIVPAIMTFLYIPLLHVVLLGGGILFLMHYLGFKVPLAHQELQKKYTHNSTALVISIIFFVAFTISFLTLCWKRNRILYINHLLRIAKVAFWPNCYIFIFPFIFTLATALSIVLDITLLSINLARKTDIIHKHITVILILMEGFMTHGIIMATSDFFYQSIGIHWYYKRRRELQKQARFFDSFFNTLQLISLHIGSIVHGFFLEYIPQVINTLFSQIEGKSPLCYHIFCLWHHYTIRELSKFCYFQTILQSFQFDVANHEMYGFRQRSKKVVPLYMMGHFYITIAKIFSVAIGFIMCYFMIDNSPQLVDIEEANQLLGPLFVVFFGGLEISNHFLSVVGLLGDTVVFTYCADIEIEKKDFGDAEPFSCPNQIRDIIYEVKAGVEYIPD